MQLIRSEVATDQAARTADDGPVRVELALEDRFCVDLLIRFVGTFRIVETCGIC